MQSPLELYIASLQNRISAIFPAANICFDGDILCLTYKRPDKTGDFVHLLVDLTIMEEDEAGKVAVQARPDHIFEKHWTLENGTRTLTLENNHTFPGGDSDESNDFGDGLGNSIWMFQYPEDKEKIADLFCGLVKMSAAYFA